MAKTSKYEDDLLLEAVVKYAEVYKGKIKTTELAEWSRKNIQGLEDVRYYHFQRPYVITDKKSNRKRKADRPCTLKLTEINNIRAIHQIMEVNTLLKSSNLDEFLQLSDADKRECIVDARMKVEELSWRVNNLEKERDTLRSENQYLLHENERMNDSLRKIVAEKRQIDLVIESLIRCVNEATKRESFIKLGIENECLSLKERNKHLSEEVDKFFSGKMGESRLGKGDSKAFAKELMFGMWDDDEDE